MTEMFDGVATLTRGDLLMIVYQKPARLHRSRWLFDRVDEFVKSSPGDKIALMIVLPTADPPDAPTRAENRLRLRRLGPALRCIVTVPVGDAFWTSVVRTIMRALAVLQGRSASTSWPTPCTRASSVSSKRARTPRR